MPYDLDDLPDEVGVFLEERHLATLTTLRADGSPPVGPSESLLNAVGTPETSLYASSSTSAFNRRTR